MDREPDRLVDLGRNVVKRGANKSLFRPTLVEKSQLETLANEDPRLKAGARQVLKALLDHHNPLHGLVCPSIRRISELTKLSEKWVRKMIRLLETTGYISVQKRAGPNGVSRYRFNLKMLDRMAQNAGQRFDDLAANHAGPELQFRKKGNWSSAKLGKELIDTEKWAGEGPIADGANGAGTSAKSGWNAFSQKTQRAIVEQFGYAEAGWGAIAELGEAALSDLVRDISQKRVAISDAPAIILKLLAERDM